jgi:arylsulfatase
VLAEVLLIAFVYVVGVLIIWRQYTSLATATWYAVPTGLGFEYFYGFIGGDANQWAPALVENIKPIEPPHDAKDYHLDKDLADRCIERIRMLHAVSPNKPWLQYYAPGTSHAPHHAPKEWIAKFKGKFDQG